MNSAHERWMWRTALQRGSQWRSGLPVAWALSLVLISQPMLALLHAAFFAVMAKAVNVFVADWAQLFFEVTLRDPRHAEIAANSLREIEVTGVAVGSPLGELLHDLAPGWFSPVSWRATGWASAMVEPGSTFLAGVATSMCAVMLLLALGRVMLFLGHRRRRSWLVGVGLVTQLGTVLEVLRQPLTLKELDAIGLSAIATKVVRLSVPDYQAVRDPFAQLEATGIPVAALALLTVVVFFVYLVPWAAARLAPAVFWCTAHRTIRAAVPKRAGKRYPGPLWSQMGLVLGVALVGLSPLQSEGVGASFQPFTNEELDPRPGESVQAELRPDASRSAPSVVEMVGEYPHYQLLVNGAPLRIRGVGYNVYASHLSPATRSAHYERDFRLMRQAGLNTILGWEQDEFDEVLLDKAHEMGLWVILPFQLPPQVESINYADPATRKALMGGLKDWVLRFRDHPAVLMYAPGNEVLTAMRSYFPQAREQQLAFATFYREMADLIHEVDPSHPVICREAEVGYVDLLQQAFRDGLSRPWFVLGTNLYGTGRTFRQGLIQRADFSWRLPGVVTEFSPVGYRPQDRPYLVTKMVRLAEDTSLLGWVLYVWTVEGPEPLDRTFGLVDGYARPVDGTLRALGVFNSRSAATSTTHESASGKPPGSPLSARRGEPLGLSSTPSSEVPSWPLGDPRRARATATVDTQAGGMAAGSL